MNYDKRILNKVLRATEAKKITAEAMAASERARVYAALPRVAEIEAELRATALDIIRSAFSSGADVERLLRGTKSKNLELQKERDELLRSGGFDTAIIEPKYECDVCLDTGYTGGELCRCISEKYRRAVTEELNESLNVGKASFAEFDLSLYSDKCDEDIRLSPRERMRDIFEFCMTYAEKFAKMTENLFMTGGSGLGKTYLASCIARTVADAGFSAVYDTTFNALGAYESEKFGRDDVSERATTRYESCELLILDNLGCEMLTSFTSAALFNLINMRLLSGKKTIVISVLTPAEIRRKYGEQLYSRLAGEFLTLTFCGEDVRLHRKRGI